MDGSYQEAFWMFDGWVAIERTVNDAADGDSEERSTRPSESFLHEMVDYRI
jgi:hypothetical protein